MIAVDTNILVYAHRADSPWHSKASKALSELANSGLWAIPWPCIHEFIAIVTNKRIYSPTSAIDLAIDQVEAWQESPTLHMIGEYPGYWEALRSLLITGRISGGTVHDARIAAICKVNGIREIWTFDRDFGKFPVVKTRNPLV